MIEQRGNLLPLYIVVDESASMGPHIEELNAGMAELYDSLLAQPMAASRIRLSILGFSNEVIRHQRLVDIRAELDFPVFSSRTTTNYGAVFSYLAAALPEDISLLKSEGYAIIRPVVFVLTDGLPSDGEAWRGPYSDLMKQNFRPNIVSFGIGDAQAEIISAISSRPDFGFISTSVNVTSAIQSFLGSLTSSVVASGRSIAAENPDLVIQKPEGFRMAIDVI
jgi:uncharacterized protein YegL